MNGKGDIFLGIAGALAASAWLFAADPADAETTPTAAGGSMNGFAINNPLNLRYIATNPFNGQTGNHNGYGIYSSLAFGVRAAGLQLTQYFNSGLVTVAVIVSKWAPSTENDTNAYISDVCARMGVSSDEVLNWDSDEVPLIQAMAYHENGYNNMSNSDVAGYIGKS